MLTRIKSLDGLRAVAVLGVLWAHIWMFFNTPSYQILHVNIAALISFFGTGVDLFFVVSGFCMYLMYVTKQTDFSWLYYFQYLKKRWLRIAPAYYVAIVIYGLYEVGFYVSQFDWKFATIQFLFLRNFFSGSHYAPHFWSLGTEWNFYLVLPFIILAIDKFSFRTALIVSIFICFVFRIYFWSSPDDLFNFKNYSIPNRLIEFMLGIVAARFYLNRQKGWIFNGNFGLLLAVFMAFTGRILMSGYFNNRVDMMGIIARVIDLPLLCSGYALLMVNVLQYKTIITPVLESKIMGAVGRYSYSMYLWHWIIAVLLTASLKDRIDISPFIQVNLVFVISLAVLYPISYFSFHFFEQFYFKKNTLPDSSSNSVSDK